MSTPYHFTPRVPAPPHPTPASASAYILPNPKSLKAPIRNPYDKFTQPEFDVWIGDITGALRRALGQDEGPTVAVPQTAREEDADRYTRYKSVEAEESDDEAIDDSFADFKARRAGKGKARDPREGPGLGKGDFSQPIHIVSSDEEEEEEVELSIAQLGDESEEEEEEEEEYSSEEEYAWEKGQSSSQPIPLERTRKRREVQQQEEEEEEEEYEEYEEEGVEDQEETGEEQEFEVEYDEEEYGEEEEEEEDQLRGSSPQVIELISDDEMEIQPPPTSKQLGKVKYQNEEEEQEEEEQQEEEEEEEGVEGEGEDQYGSEEYAEYSGEEEQEDKESLSPEARKTAVRGADFINATRAERVTAEEEPIEILQDEEEIQPIEPEDIEPAIPAKWRRALDMRSRVEIPDPWDGPRTYAQDFYSGGDVRLPAGAQVDASHLGPQDEDFGRDNADHAEEAQEVHDENAEEVQPISEDTSFPPDVISTPAAQRDVEISDPWSGPRHYAQDFYSGGTLNLPPNATANPDNLGPDDSQYVDVDAQEEILEEEIENEVQPVEADESFPPHEASETKIPAVIADRWEGPQIYAEDFYSGGDVRMLPGEPVDPSLLSGTGDLDDGIDAFLTPGALSPSQSERIAILAEEGEDVPGPAGHYVPVPSKLRHPIPADAEFISIDDSDEEQEKAEGTKLQDEPLVSEVADYSGLYDFEGVQESDLQEIEQHVDEVRNLKFPSPVEHGDRFKQLSQEDLQSISAHISQEYHYESDEESFEDNEIKVHITNGRPSVAFPSTSGIPTQLLRKELSAAASQRDTAQNEVEFDEAEAESVAVKPSPTLETEPEIVQEEIIAEAAEVSAEHDVLDIHIEDISVYEGNSAVITTDVTSPAADISAEEAMSDEEIQEVSFTEGRLVLAEDITDIDAEISIEPPATGLVDDLETQDIQREKEIISVDDIELEVSEPFAVDQGTEKEERPSDIPMQEIPSDLDHDFYPPEEHATDEELPDSNIPPSPEVHFGNHVQEVPSSTVDSTSQRPVQEVSDEDRVSERPILFAEVVENYSATHAAFEAIVDEFSDEDADGEVDGYSEIISIATASDMHERQTYDEDEYTIEEPVTEGRRTEEPPERGMSLRVISVEPDEVAATVDQLAKEGIKLDDISHADTAIELLQTQDGTAVALEEEILLTETSESLAEITSEEKAPREILSNESKMEEDIKHSDEIRATVDSAAIEATVDSVIGEAKAHISAKPEPSIPSIDLSTSNVLAPQQSEETDEQPTSVSLPLTPSLVETLRKRAVSPRSDNVQVTSSEGLSSSTSGKDKMRDEVNFAIDRAFFSPTLPNYFGDLSVEVPFTQVPISDLDEWIKSPSTTSATISAIVPPTSPTSVPALTPTPVPASEPVATTEALPEISESVPVTTTVTASPDAPSSVPAEAGASSNAPSTFPLGVTLTRPRMPVLVPDPYPISLSTPYGAFTFFMPEEGSEEDTGLDNSISSNSTLEQDKGKKTSTTVADDADDLEFQYPPEHVVIEELKNAGLPIPDLQPSKAETGAPAVPASTSTHLDEISTATPTTTTAAGEAESEAQPTKSSSPKPVLPPSSSKEADNLIVVNVPRATSVETKPQPTAAKTSSKRSQKRKRDISPAPGSSSQVEPPVGPKGKGKRTSKSERKVKVHDLKELVPEPTSEETIRVRPRPKGSLEQPSKPEKSTEKSTDGVPPFRLLHSGDRASSIASSTPSDVSAGLTQPSPTVNKPNKPAPQPLPQASLFHAHGKGKKQPLPTFRPRSVKLILPEPPSVPIASTSRATEQPVSTGAPIVEVPKAGPVSEAVSPPTSDNTTTTPPLTISISSSKIASKSAPSAPTENSTVPETLSAASPASTAPVVNPSTPSTHIHASPATAAETPSSSQHISHRARTSRLASMTSSPVTRSHCKYHRISLPKEEGGPRVCFLVPGCSLNDKELMEDEEIEDHGDATVEDSYRMIKEIESLGFHSDLIGILRQLVGLDILREQEVFYLPAPGEEVLLRKNPLKKTPSEKISVARVPLESSSNAGSPGYSGGFAASPGSWKTATPLAGSDYSASVTGRRSFIDSEKESSFVPTDTEQGLSDVEEPETKRARPSPPEELLMGPPPLIQASAKAKLKRHRRAKPKAPKPEGEAGGVEDEKEKEKEKEKESKKPRKSTTSAKRGVKRSRTSENVNTGEGEERSLKKLKAQSNAPSALSSPEKPEKPVSAAASMS